MICQQLNLSGIVQGVGFRPFVYRLAVSLELSGHISNTTQGVFIELRGEKEQVECFKARLLAESPIHARIDRLSIQKTTPLDTQHSEPRKIEPHFKILSTPTDAPVDPAHSIDIPTDRALCQACLKELFDSENKRFHYPFINCTDCGPRYSLIKALPYERHNTSMSVFTACASCEQEYQNPSDRRFYSQINACEACGPRLSLQNKQGKLISNNNPISELATFIKAGKIVALKGLGGFHLICDAHNAQAVRKLRQGKQRPDKPFAIMALNSLSLTPYVELNDDSKQHLAQSTAPIVLLPKKADCDELLKGIAPGLNQLGCMLPYTALHYLLFQALSEHSSEHDWLTALSETALVITSANLSGEPLIIENESCRQKLSPIADYFLVHDRDITLPCDDSVIQSSTVKHPTLFKHSAAFKQDKAQTWPLRLGRAYAPKSIPLPVFGHAQASPTILACGAFLKNTFCITHNNKAYVSPHMGELGSAESCVNFSASIEHYLQVLKLQPDIIVSDLHPDFYSTEFAERYSQEHNIPLLRVQHHRAHIAATFAEHALKKNLNLREPILALALDGVGLGDDQSAWGGELFYGQVDQLKRIGHLSAIALPGGDIATREIWRIGATVLYRLNEAKAQERYQAELANPMIKHMLTLNDHPQTSSAGRWFDAFASIIGLRDKTSFEGQAAMELESLAEACQSPLAPQQLARINDDNTLDLKPILSELLHSTLFSSNQLVATTADKKTINENKQLAAAQFHIELIDGLFRWLRSASVKYNTRTIVCSGGCFQNKMLRLGLQQLLISEGYVVYLPEQFPANDAGISLGQAFIANMHVQSQKP